MVRHLLSVVIPTLHRPDHLRGLLENLASQELLPDQIVVVDGADSSDLRSGRVVSESRPDWNGVDLVHLRSATGTAVQRNVGIDRATGRFIAFVDDDIRLEPGFLRTCADALSSDEGVGAVCGLIVDQVIDPSSSAHWRWMRRMRCFGNFEPGHFDEASGHPIPRYLGGIHTEHRDIEVMGAGCAVWRREVFDHGLRFDPWFTGYGMLEDVHLSIRAAQTWTLMELGNARCSHLRAVEARPNAEELAFRSVVSYRYLFRDLVRRPALAQELRWWYTQLIDTARLVAALRNGREAVGPVRGKLRGLWAARRRR